MTREELLPLLQQRVMAQDAAPLSAAAATALHALNKTADPVLGETLSALTAAQNAPEIRVLAARALRLLANAAHAAQPPEPERAPRDRKTRDKARVARVQANALKKHRAQPERPALRPVETLSGVGEALGQALRARGVRTASDLAWMLPLGYVDERQVTPLSELVVGQRQMTEGTVVSARPFGGGHNGRMAEVWLAPDAQSAGALRLTWFRAPPGLLARFGVGMRYQVAGIVEAFRGQIQITHPETTKLGPNDTAAARGIVPRYPTIAGVPPRRLASFIQRALASALPDIDEAVPAALREKYQLSPLKTALAALHAPPRDLDDEDLVRWNEARSEHHARLAFEEFFVLELTLFRRRVEDQGICAEAMVAKAPPIERVRSALGFELTSAQQRVVAEIFADLGETTPMRRLLQGDVGSGKTAVGMLAASQVIAAGAQVAFMAPTEILAEQHFRSLAPIAAALGMRAALVLGGERASHRKKTRKALEDGTLDLVVGTHALLSEGVRFARLRLVIIDEQHRFGVGQRLRLVDKTEQALAPHLLVMTATPIPRTLALALHGDLEVSVIDELPAGRVAPTTRAYPAAERERALIQLERALVAGGQAYVVCPSIEESAETGLSSVETTFSELSKRFAAYGVALLHGKLKGDAKASAMERFIKGEVRVLVATTVVEVGVDVPRANVMLIENAERFGLSQLHQLRGRVGRGGQRSACLLVHQAASEDSRSRIETMCATTDGFRIAEADLQIRGPGELFGQRQSGLPGFRFGDLRRDAPLLARAREAAQEVIARDPELELPEHAAARGVLDRASEGPRRVVREEAG
ncbi:MAG TPA: ATP-dependent DNA helicase RecG [Polyangiales bacterium]|nr:ATP-dependent DNA helicase RecG [Polyangiales bacterium]